MNTDSHIFLNTLAASLPIMIHCLLTKNIQPGAVQSSVAPLCSAATSLAVDFGDRERERRRMRAEKLKREACEVLRFRSHKYSQEEKPRQSACDTSAETREANGEGGERERGWGGWWGVNNSAELLSRLFVKRCQKRLRTRGVSGRREVEGNVAGGRERRRASGLPETGLSSSQHFLLSPLQCKPTPVTTTRI